MNWDTTNSRAKGSVLMRLALWLLLVAATAIPGTAQNRPRGRDLGIPFPGQTGPMNAITDVAGVAAQTTTGWTASVSLACLATAWLQR